MSLFTFSGTFQSFTFYLKHPKIKPSDGLCGKEDAIFSVIFHVSYIFITLNFFRGVQSVPAIGAIEKKSKFYVVIFFLMFSLFCDCCDDLECGHISGSLLQ